MAGIRGENTSPEMKIRGGCIDTASGFAIASTSENLPSRSGLLTEHAPSFLVDDTGVRVKRMRGQLASETDPICEVRSHEPSFQARQDSGQA